MNTQPKPIIVTKNVRHDFTPEERNTIGADLARSIGAKRGHEVEFDQVKATYKSRIAEADARIDSLSTSLMNGFDMRNTKCRVEFQVEEGKKHYFIADEALDTNSPEAVLPVLTEDMTPEDYQAELIQAESYFDQRQCLDLFPAVNGDSGNLIIGTFRNRWYSAIRIKLGNSQVEERLDAEQRAFKKRADAVSTAGKRALDWLKQTLGKETAKGFEQGISDLVKSQSEREE